MVRENLGLYWKLKVPIILHDDVYFDEVERGFQTKKDIGWRLCLDGYLSHEWANIQQYYFMWI